MRVCARLHKKSWLIIKEYTSSISDSEFLANLNLLWSTTDDDLVFF